MDEYDTRKAKGAKRRQGPKSRHDYKKWLNYTGACHKDRRRRPAVRRLNQEKRTARHRIRNSFKNALVGDVENTDERVAGLSTRSYAPYYPNYEYQSWRPNPDHAMDLKDVWATLGYVRGFYLDEGTPEEEQEWLFRGESHSDVRRAKVVRKPYTVHDLWRFKEGVRYELSICGELNDDVYARVLGHIETNMVEK